MDFKLTDILVIILALAIPIVVLALAFTPGGFTAIFDFAAKPAHAPYAFGAAAVLVFGLFGWRIYRRIRPAPPKPREAAANFFDFLRRPKE